MDRRAAGPTGFWTQALFTTLNSLLYTLTLGRFLWLEGRREGKYWRNWTHGQKHLAEPYCLPRTEQEIVEAVRSHPKLRVVGSGHSFNSGVVGQATLSLDAYTGIVSLDDTQKRVRVRAGTRVREVNRLLQAHRLALVALPSHDAQSLAGILSTDVHGTGREVGFVSQSVIGLRIVDGRGEILEAGPEDELFQAAIGGIGGVGIIIEVTLQCVEPFHIRQRSLRLERSRARAEMMDILAEHDHASLYVFPFAKHLQLHTWDRTEEPRSRLAWLREYVMITFAALSAAWLGDFLAWCRLLPKLSDQILRTQKNTSLVMESFAGFNRTIYHMHQELEFAVPVERTWEVTEHLLGLYEELYRKRRMPFTLIELRFTPAGHYRSLLSPGAGDRKQVYVNLVCNQSPGFEEYFAAAEEYMRTIQASPHLGKWCASWTHNELSRVHGERFERFKRLRREHDPQGRFSNAFTERMLGPVHDDRDAIFEPWSCRNLRFKNRIIRSSVGGRFDNYDGTGTQARLNWEERFAKNGVGAIISAFCAVTAQGVHMPNFATIEDDDRIPFWREVGRRVQAQDGCRFILQLHHCGRQRDLGGVRNAAPKAPSSTSRPDPLNGFPARAMSRTEIQEVIQAFVEGARRAREAGLDGAEIHAANGYLLSQFLSSAINDRSDEYGGNIENRARMLVEIIQGIRGRVGSDWHLQVKLNAEDRNNAVFPWLSRGNSIQDAISIAQLAVQAGADAIHLSCGSSFPHPHNPPGPMPLQLLKSTYDSLISEGHRTFANYVLLHFRPTRWLYGKIWSRTQSPDFEGSLASLTARMKQAIEVPVIITGGFQQASLIRSVIEAGQADAVSIARPLVANPDLVRWFEKGWDVPERPCTFCNRCLANMIEHPMGCYEPRRFNGDRERMIEEIVSVYRPQPW